MAEETKNTTQQVDLQLATMVLHVILTTMQMAEMLEMGMQPVQEFPMDPLVQEEEKGLGDYIEAGQLEKVMEPQEQDQKIPSEVRMNKHHMVQDHQLAMGTVLSIVMEGCQDIEKGKEEDNNIITLYQKQRMKTALVTHESYNGYLLSIYQFLLFTCTSKLEISKLVFIVLNTI